LTIAALPDPRVYGSGGVYGSNDSSVVHTLQRSAADSAVQGVPASARFDIFATHEPVAADELVHDLPGQIRQTNAGHEHAQNADTELQHDGVISLVEGSTGAGGLDNINRGVPAPPVEFSIESVAASCEFTKLVRFQLQGPPPSASDTTSVGGQQVVASTLYLDRQPLAQGRTCSLAAGRGRRAGHRWVTSGRSASRLRSSPSPLCSPSSRTGSASASGCRPPRSS
jgi:hypothetical protein